MQLARQRPPDAWARFFGQMSANNGRLPDGCHTGSDQPTWRYLASGSSWWMMCCVSVGTQVFSPRLSFSWFMAVLVCFQVARTSTTSLSLSAHDGLNLGFKLRVTSEVHVLLRLIFNSVIHFIHPNSSMRPPVKWTRRNDVRIAVHTSSNSQLLRVADIIVARPRLSSRHPRKTMKPRAPDGKFTPSV